MPLELAPISLHEANAYVECHHRHHHQTRGCLFCIAATVHMTVSRAFSVEHPASLPPRVEPAAIVAVAIVGRPVARNLQDGYTAEVLRVCAGPWWECECRTVSDESAFYDPLAGACRVCGGPLHTENANHGYRNACSFLYGRAWRAAQALGYKRMVTYTLPEEGGASPSAAGMKLIGEAGGGSWSRESRPRIDLHPTQEKLRWELAV